MIKDVQVIPLRRIPDERGTILHMLKCTDAHFQQFGEIYFSTVYPGVIKAWHKHREMTLNYACVEGRIKLVLYDDRPDSPSRGELMELFIGQDDYSLVIIPPGIWNGFKGMSFPHAVVANCATHLHDPSEMERLEFSSAAIPYDWAVKNR
jgi:dTDP-4-dehydrorhamnose 3,5-epimerase